MNSTETITLEILAKDLASGNISTFVGHIDQAAKKGGILGSVFQGVGQHVGSSIASMFDPTQHLVSLLDNAGASALKLGEGVITGAIQEQATLAKLDTALKTNTANWDGNMTAIEQATFAGQSLAFGQQDIEKAVTSLITRTKNLNTALAIIPVAEDLARFKGIDLQTTTLALGKAYDGSSGSLTRMGIHLDKGTKGMDAIRAAAKLVAGQSKTTASTFEGQMAVMGTAIQNTQENIGTQLMPQLTDWITQLNSMLFKANSILGTVTGDASGWQTAGWGGPSAPFGSRHRPKGSHGSTRGYASGGVIGAGGWGIVGENGPEMIYNSGSGGIGVVPNGSGIHVHFHSAYPPSPQEGERIAQALAPHLRREMTRIGA